MGSLFEGAPQTATSYSTTSTETPKWMQDAIFNQIQWSTNIANKPYEAYGLPTIAEMSPLQTQAYSNVVANQGSWKPTLNTVQSGLTNLTNKSALTAATPYLTAAAAPSTANISAYMSPYQQNVMDVIAKQGARNLSEILLPQVSDAFIKAGQFGGSRMGEFGSRALRDTQEKILDQQSNLANTGYQNALSASSADLSRLAGLGSTTGGLTSADIASTQGALTQLADTAKLNQGLSTADTAALEAAGQAQQAQQQAQLTEAQRQYIDQLNYPKQQLDWLSTQVRGMAPNVASTQSQSGGTTGASYSASPLSQLASGYSLYKGLTQ